MRSLATLVRHVSELRAYYVAIAVCSVLIAVSNLLTPFILKGATDRVVAAATGHRGGLAVIMWYVVALLAAEMLNSLVMNVGGYAGDVMAARMKAILSSRYYGKLLRLPQRYFDQTLTGTIISRLNRSIAETIGFLNSFSNNFFPMLVTLVAVLGISAFYSWPLALLLLVVFPVYMWLTTLTSKRWQRLEKLKNAQVDRAGGRFNEVVGQVRVVKSFATEQREYDTFTERFARTIRLTRGQSSWWHSMDVLRRWSLNLIFFGVYAIILVQAYRGRFSVGTMVMLLQLVAMAKAPVASFSWIVDTAQRAIAGTRDYFAVMAEQEEDDELRVAERGTGGELVADPAAPAIELRDATFGYVEGEDVLSGISFTVRPGERVALVGESGGGKTTVVNLLLGLYPLRSGSVRFFGADLSSMSLDLVRRNVGVVFQDPSLFSGTIAENIAYAHPDAPMSQVEDVSRRANAHDFIAKFRDGYHSTIGERGLKLSGGQKQRIAVARAMLKDAPILVLDEATSALDTRSERLVQQGLDELMHGRTSIIIAHRLSTIASVDRIITLRDGRVDEIGSPAELAESGGIYAQLLALQAEGGKRNRKRLAAYDIAG